MSTIILVASEHHRDPGESALNLPFYRKEMDSLGETGPGPVGDLGFSLVSVLVLDLWFFLTALLSGGT